MALFKGGAHPQDRRRQTNACNKNTNNKQPASIHSV